MEGSTRSHIVDWRPDEPTSAGTLTFAESAGLHRSRLLPIAQTTGRCNVADGSWLAMEVLCCRSMCRGIGDCCVSRFCLVSQAGSSDSSTWAPLAGLSSRSSPRATALCGPVNGGGFLSWRSAASLSSPFARRGESPRRSLAASRSSKQPKVDARTAPQWVAIAAVSAVAGASLGPSFALVVMGGGLGSWIANRRWAEGGADPDYTLTGIAGGFGAAFTSPVLGAFLVSELEPIPRQRYVASIIPQLIASMIGFVIFYAVVGRTFLGSYEVPPYEFEVVDMAIAVGLGVLSAIVMLVFVGVILAVKWVCKFVPNRYILGILGGATVGLIAMALPLTVGAGQSQLGVVIDDPAALGVGLLIIVLLAKMVAMALSLEVGFMGGNVFPLIFMGGTAGTVVYLAFPDIPIALAVSCMLAAVPGSFLRAPVSMTFIAAIALALGAETTAPVAVAVVTSYLIVAGVRYAVSGSARRAAATKRHTGVGPTIA